MTLSDVQLQNIHQELQAQLMWRTSQLDELKAQMEYEGADRQTALADLAATDRIIAEIGLFADSALRSTKRVWGSGPSEASTS
ncbi:hypothetical protein AB0K48_54380, partial [Nonomuraea sp. NPDC055795]